MDRHTKKYDIVNRMFEDALEKNEPWSKELFKQLSLVCVSMWRNDLLLDGEQYEDIFNFLCDTEDEANYYAAHITRVIEALYLYDIVLLTERVGEGDDSLRAAVYTSEFSEEELRGAMARVLVRHEQNEDVCNDCGKTWPCPTAVDIAHPRKGFVDYLESTRD
jgi:hypothetical protein